MGQQSSKPSVVEVYAQWVLKYPHLAQKGVLISGAPETDLSDVDISIYVPNGMTWLRTVYEDCKIANYNVQINDHTSEGYITMKFTEFSRPVNVRYTIHEAQLRRTLQHRMNELHLCTMYPDLADSVRKLKILPDGSSESTEKAWAQVLKVSGDPYDYMAGQFDTLSADAETAKQDAFII